MGIINSIVLCIMACECFIASCIIKSDPNIRLAVAIIGAILMGTSLIVMHMNGMLLE